MSSGENSAVGIAFNLDEAEAMKRELRIEGFFSVAARHEDVELLHAAGPSGDHEGC